MISFSELVPSLRRDGLLVYACIGKVSLHKQSEFVGNIYHDDFLKMVRTGGLPMKPVN